MKDLKLNFPGSIDSKKILKYKTAEFKERIDGEIDFCDELNLHLITKVISVIEKCGARGENST
jgi:hypothetical protein